MAKWPPWWDWELELSGHVCKRMVDRGFTEVDLRLMLEEDRAVRRSDVPGRWIVETTHDGEPWEVVVEPDWTDRVLVVVTAYEVDE